ncbi:MAG: protein BatD [Pseudomonadales bacterium]|nr:protein BatD [Pseudomonadales bacterium]MCP5346072.1 protein BatD [Pseudomonadales bacterium]
MVRLKSIFLAALLLVSFSAGAQEVEAFLDRAEIARGDTVELTIRVFQQQNTQLDLSPLRADFDILASRTSQQIRSINNQVESWTDYVITLFPTREGEIEIPALQVGSQQTSPITLTVEDQGPNSNQGNSELFLETEVNKESVFVQEQLLFTIRLFYTISGIRNPQFTELDMPDTVIQLIGSPNQYERLIDGERYGVYEMRYVIFPQRSGPLEIPDILFRGEVTDGSSNFVFRNLNTQRVTAYIEGKTIEVKERPAAAQGLETWLPASNVTLEESWDQDISNLQVGQTLKRTVTLVAEGLDGAVLPPFSPEQIDGVNLYADPADISRTFVEGEIVGTRVESASLVPTRAGIVEIPELSVPWWDINSNELRYATLPASRLSIATIDGELPSEQLVQDDGRGLESEAAAPVLNQDMIDAQNQSRLINIPVIWFNLFIGAAVLVVLASIYLLVIRSFNISPMDSLRGFARRLADSRKPQNNERIAFGELQNSLRNGDPKAIRSALLIWANHFYAPAPIRSMEDIIRLSAGSPLSGFALEVQTALYNSETQARIDSAKVEQQLIAMRRLQQDIRREVRRNEPYNLPPLYRT